jgi:hypothetical protein
MIKDKNRRQNITQTFQRNIDLENVTSERKVTVVRYVILGH